MPSQIVFFRAPLHLACAALLATALVAGTGTGAAADLPPKGGTSTTKTLPPPGPATPPAAAGTAATTASDDEAAANRIDEDIGPAGRHRARVQIDDFDSFRQAMNVAPWIVGVVFLVLGSIFLTPIILLVGIIWYKLRKTRMQNDAVLKLAESGVMPSAQAVDAVVSGTSPAQAAPVAVGSAFPQMVASRRRAVWSDLRKGVLMIAIGLALSLYSVAESESPNWVGLVLLFVGIGYVALWWLEDRHLERRAGPPTGSGGT